MTVVTYVQPQFEKNILQDKNADTTTISLSKPATVLPDTDVQTVTREKLFHALRLNKKKQLKLERLNKYNSKLSDELKQERIKTSNCALMVIDYTETHEDHLLNEIWGSVEPNRYRNVKKAHSSSEPMVESPISYESNECCTIM
ncbi:Ste18 protein [Martiniozyma asiatica (nom. inval.)]|nr:Ste18 protein [Martiniozyma asiatica]